MGQVERMECVMPVMPKLRIIGRFMDLRIGEIISPGGGLRKILLDRGAAEFVEPAPKTGSAPPKRKRGRPRKNA